MIKLWQRARKLPLPSAGKWMMLAALIGLVAGIGAIVFQALIHTTQHYAFHNKRGEVRPLTPIIKTIASAITLGTGGSGGREGPIAQIGAGFGSMLAKWLHLSARDRRIMLAAGMGPAWGLSFERPWLAHFLPVKFSIAMRIWKPT